MKLSWRNLSFFPNVFVQGFSPKFLLVQSGTILPKIIALVALHSGAFW